jgi:hypothetical protein
VCQRSCATPEGRSRCKRDRPVHRKGGLTDRCDSVRAAHVSKRTAIVHATVRLLIRLRRTARLTCDWVRSSRRLHRGHAEVLFANRTRDDLFFADLKIGA